MAHIKPPPNRAAHPRQALFNVSANTNILPVCDHYAGSEAKMHKALRLQADTPSQTGHAVFDVTLDLEDGAALGGEHDQALMVAELVAGNNNVFDRVGVRVHDPSHPQFENDINTLTHLAGHRLAYIMVPKLADLAEAVCAIKTIEQARFRHGIARCIPVHGLIETHSALQQVDRIAALTGITSLSFGLMDFVSEHQGAIPASAMTAQGQFSHPLILRAKLAISAACHAAGITPSHCVVTEFKDHLALAQAAKKACRELGYTRMWSIHPEQIPTILDAFAPVAAEIDEAASILLAGQAAQWGPVAHHHVLHDRASYRYHWGILERAWLTGQTLPNEVIANFFENQKGN